MKRLARAVLAAAAAAPLLVGCGSLLGSDVPADLAYHLRPSAGEALAPTIPAELVVMRPLARPGLDTDRIVVALPDRRLDSYRGSRWSAPLPDLVQSLLLDELRGRSGWRTVLPDRGEFRGAYVLQTEVRDFQAEYASAGAAPMVRVTLLGQLGRAPERSPVGSAAASGEQRAASNRMSDVAAAFEAAYAQAATRLTSQIHAKAVEAERAAAARTSRPYDASEAAR
jgi:cholesterol transport system auxiliary component